jgi:prepilin signal peptidase PulO-like enzyme (type II secretory pathway)
MSVLVVVGGFVLGWIANLLADSVPFHQKPSLPHCPACGARYKWYAWSGTFTFVFQRRACRYCGRKRTLRWPLVELSFAGWCLFLLSIYSEPLAFASALLLSFSFLILLITDIEHHIIPHAISLPAIGIMLILRGLTPDVGWTKTLLGGLGGFLIVFGFFLLGGLFSLIVTRLRGEQVEEVAFGFGDVTLAALIGVAIGWPGVILAIFIGFLAGGIFSAMYLVITKLRGTYVPLTAIPYGPFMVLGGSLVYIGGRELFTSIFLT